MPEPREHARHRNWFESILRHIPGFHGYLEKEYRRESDRLVRQWLANRLKRAKPALQRYSHQLVDSGQLDLLPQLDRLNGRLDRLIGRFLGAMRGYSGIFDYVKINERILDKIYEHDVALIELVDNIGVAVEKLPQDTQQLSKVLQELHTQIDAVERKLDSREDILEGVD